MCVEHGASGQGGFALVEGHDVGVAVAAHVGVGCEGLDCFGRWVCACSRGWFVFFILVLLFTILCRRLLG